MFHRIVCFSKKFHPLFQRQKSIFHGIPPIFPAKETLDTSLRAARELGYGSPSRWASRPASARPGRVQADALLHVRGHWGAGLQDLRADGSQEEDDEGVLAAILGGGSVRVEGDSACGSWQCPCPGCPGYLGCPGCPGCPGRRGVRFGGGLWLAASASHSWTCILVESFHPWAAGPQGRDAPLTWCRAV